MGWPPSLCRNSLKASERALSEKETILQCFLAYREAEAPFLSCSLVTLTSHSSVASREDGMMEVIQHMSFSIDQYAP